MANHSEFLAKFGTDDHQEKLLSKPDGRLALAMHSDQPMLDKVTDHLHKHNNIHSKRRTPDDDNDIRAATYVIGRGNQHNRDKLFDTTMVHEQQFTGAAMAKHGTPEQKTAMISHSAPYVRMAVAQSGSDSDREKLMKDPDNRVRISVSEAPSLSLVHAKKLANHEDRDISMNAIKNIHRRISHLKDTELQDLQKHDHSTVRNIANREVKDRSELNDFMNSIKDDELLKDK